MNVPAEFFFRVPPYVLEGARARKRLIRKKSSSFPFRMTIILTTAHLDPRLGHFLLKDNENGETLRLLFKHQGDCARTANVTESSGEVRVRVEGACSCRADLTETVCAKIQYIWQWQGSSQHCPTDFREALQSIRMRIDQRSLPVADSNERELLALHLGRETMDEMLAKFNVRGGLRGGSEGRDQPTEVVEEKETTTTGEKSSWKLGIEGWLFELIGIKNFFVEYVQIFRQNYGKS